MDESTSDTDFNHNYNFSFSKDAEDDVLQLPTRSDSFKTNQPIENKVHWRSKITEDQRNVVRRKIKDVLRSGVLGYSILSEDDLQHHSNCIENEFLLTSFSMEMFLDESTYVKRIIHYQKHFKQF